MRYRMLKDGELVRRGDQYRGCGDGWTTIKSGGDVAHGDGLFEFRRPAGKRNPAASSQLRKVASPRRYCDASKNSFCNGVNCWWPKVPCKWRKPATIA